MRKAVILAGSSFAVIILVFGAILGTVTDSAAQQINVGAPVELNPDGLPPWAPDLLNRYGTTCPEVTPPVLAAQIEAESGWNPNAVSPVGAQGLTQFMPGTWATYGTDGDGDGKADPFNPADAVASQSRYMCQLVAQVKAANINGDVLDNALASYNAGFGSVKIANGIPPFPETQNYVARIRSLIGKYSKNGNQIGGAASGDAAAVLAAASKWVGTPYAWGGGTLNGPSGGMPPDVGVIGFDCSSLARYAFYQGTGGKITLPRTSAAQYAATISRPVPKDQLVPGDLMFWGSSPGTIHHIAIYIGNGQMIEAPQSGQTVHITGVRLTGDFLGATRVL
ncbi:NlpC/P60 family protein [Amycolatopsis sp. NPDC051903]|uniref:C40 family peptidase n=1 Tax=Amycolatopsis sp. NPDC051903 TaxID=3363936 RepID=UPI0037A2FEE9